MSIGPTFVKAYDGYFYQDPILRGDGWFICFDEDEPPELVIADTCKRKPSEILDAAGIKYARIRPHIAAGRIFSKGSDREGVPLDLRDSHSYFFDLKRALNPKLITENSGRHKKPGFGTFYDFDLGKGAR